MSRLVDIMDINIVGYNIPSPLSRPSRLKGDWPKHSQFFQSISTPAQRCSSREYFGGVLPQSPASPEREVQRQRKDKKRKKRRDGPGMCLEHRSAQNPTLKGNFRFHPSPFSSIFPLNALLTWLPIYSPGQHCPRTLLHSRFWSRTVIHEAFTRRSKNDVR